MSIYKVNNDSAKQTQINQINDMVIENSGKIDDAAFDKIELDQLYTDLGIDRKFLRNQVIGGTTTTYSGWSHLKAETGYSIWKFSPTSYVYNASNRLYFDGKLVENRGNASAESATTFDAIKVYNGASGNTYTDNTAEASTENGTFFNLMATTEDYLYVGDAATFAGVKLNFDTRGSNYTLKIEYYSDASGVNNWVELTANVDDLDDNTNDFGSNGYISFTEPSDWGLTTVDSNNCYWIRISTTTTPVTTATAFYVIPYNSVPALLAMSSTQFLNEEWAWCSYSNSIYVTIKNTGQSAYEGNYYITSSSSSTNLQNYFVYNHQFTSNYQDSNYVASGLVLVTLTDANASNSMIYYSSTQSKLCYKDSGGVVRTLY